MFTQKHAELRLLQQKGQLTDKEIQDQLVAFANELENYSIEKFVSGLQITNNNKLINIYTGDIVQSLYGRMLPPVDDTGILCGYRLRARSINSRQLDIYIKVNFDRLHEIIQNGSPIPARSTLNELLDRDSDSSQEEHMARVQTQTIVETPVKYPMVNRKIYFIY